MTPLTIDQTLLKKNTLAIDKRWCKCTNERSERINLISIWFQYRKMFNLAWVWHYLHQHIGQTNKNRNDKKDDDVVWYVLTPSSGSWVLFNNIGSEYTIITIGLNNDDCLNVQSYIGCARWAVNKTYGISINILCLLHCISKNRFKKLGLRRLR